MARGTWGATEGQAMRVRVAERLRWWRESRENGLPHPDLFTDTLSVPSAKALWDLVFASHNEDGEANSTRSPWATDHAADIAESIAYAEPPRAVMTPACLDEPLSRSAGDAATIARQIREDREALCR